MEKISHHIAGAVLAMSLLDGINTPLPSKQPAPIVCEQFLLAFTPVLAGDLTTAVQSLSYTPASGIWPEIYPDPSYAKGEIIQVVSAIQTSPIVHTQDVQILEQVYGALPSEENLTQMKQSRVTNATFATQRREIAAVQVDLQKNVALCEDNIPKSMRRDEWYKREQFSRSLDALWQKYGLEVLVIFLFLGAGIIEAVFFDNK